MKNSLILFYVCNDLVVIMAMLLKCFHFTLIRWAFVLLFVYFFMFNVFLELILRTFNV